MAHALHARDYVGTTYGINYSNKCGLLGYHRAQVTVRDFTRSTFSWYHGIVLMDCKLDETIQNFLCQVDDPMNRREGSKPALPVSSASLQSIQWDSRFTICSSRHVTHSFLACDDRSACWTQGVVSFSNERATWDLPSPLSCPVPGMTSLPPSFACAAGSSRVPYSFVCDHQRDCGDFSDEEFCQFKACRGEKALQCGASDQVKHGD